MQIVLKKVHKVNVCFDCLCAASSSFATLGGLQLLHLLQQFASTKMISRLQCLKQVSRVALASRASASTSSGSSAPGASTTAISKSDEFQDIETHTGQVSCCYYWWWSLWMITNTLVNLIGVWEERLPSGSICRQDEKGLCCQLGTCFQFLKSYLIYLLTSRTQVNPRWAIKLVDEIPPTPVADRFVSCNGGGGPLGHPKVFINLDAPGNHACGYCGLRFFQEKSDHHH